MQILQAKIKSMDFDDEVTLQFYLKNLLIELWKEAEGFSGKRPFGNSGWQYDVYASLIKQGFIEGELDEDGYVDKCDTKKADQEIIKAIASF